MENKSGDGEKERERKTLDRISWTERKSLVVIHLRDTHRYRRNRLCSERKPAWKLDERSFQVVPKFDSRGIGRLSHGPGILRVQKRFTGHRRPVAHFSPPPPHTQLDSTTHETSPIDRSIDRVHPNSNISPIFNSSNSIQFMRKNRVANRSVISSQFASWQTWISDISGDENFTANCPLRFLLFFRFNDCQGLFVTSRAV